MNKAWFTFVELIVSVTIIAILTAIWAFSYTEFIWDSRDSQRKSDIGKVTSALKVFKQKRGYFSTPWSSFTLVNNTHPVAQQWLLDKNVRLQTLDLIPIDPKAKIPYFFSVTSSKQEFQIAATLENSDNPITLLQGNYKSVSKNILPSIILAKANVTLGTQVEISEWATEIDSNDTGTNNRNLFLFNELGENLPYEIGTGLPYSSGMAYADLLNEAENTGTFWQNNDYRNCTEIKEAGKTISDFITWAGWYTTEQYQILTDTGVLVNTNCHNTRDDYTDCRNTPDTHTNCNIY